MPPIRSSAPGRYNKLITLIISISKVIPSYSYYVKKGLVYITITAPSGRQPSSYTKYIKANMRSSCDVRSISNTKYTCLLTLYSYLVPYLISFRVLSLIRY